MRLSSTMARCVLLLLALAPFGHAQIGSLGRYGHAVAYLPSPPTLLIHGGKSDPSNAYSYTSAPNTNTMLVLPLDQPFPTSSPPITEVSTDAPDYAWHCLVPSDREDELLSFGGDGGPALAVQTNSDSSWLLKPQVYQGQVVNVSASQQAPPWAQQPMRRVHHSCAGRCITGGLRNDGSGIAFNDVFAFTGSSFERMPSLPSSLYHHTSLLLPNGTLLIMGGVLNDNGQVKLASLNTLWSLDTTTSQPSWASVTIPGLAPTPRRGPTVALNTAGNAAVLIGGTSLDLSQPSAEAWRLELGELGWTKVADSALARFDHVAILAGDDQVLVFGGYGTSRQVDDVLEIFSFSSNSFIDGFIPRFLSQPEDRPPSGTAGNSGPPSGESSSSESSTPSSPDANQAGGGDEGRKPEISPPSNPSPSSPSEPDRKGSLTLPIALGTILGLLACAAAGLGILWYRRKMRRRRQGPYNRQPPKREYAPDPEKDGQGLLLERSATRVRLAPGPQPQSAVPMIHRHLRSVKRVLSTGSRTTRRFDMLVDEDSRLFEASKGEDEHWKSAASLLGSDHDEQEETWESPPLVRGGPVPTPRLTSLASQNPFDDPPVADSPSTDPPSLSSRRSLSMTNEPGTIHTASVITRTFVPIERTETFLNRLTGVFLGTPSSTPPDERIRDPTPAPSLWPLDSSNLFGETPSLELRPPVSFAFRPGVPPGQSVSSLATAQSYRDKEVVQRERARTETTDDQGDEGNVGLGLSHSEEKDEVPVPPVSESSNAASETVKQVIINDFAVPLRHITPPPSIQTSPAATPSPRHVRRPVREVVASINKRASPNPPRTRTTYAAVRKSALVVTNPDGLVL